jgi:hypothetical protein
MYYGDGPSFLCSPELSHGHGQVVVTILLKSLASFVGLVVEGGSIAVDPYGPATPPDERDAEVHCGSIKWSDTAHRMRFGRANGLRWVFVATEFGHQFGLHDGWILRGCESEGGFRAR